MMKTWILLFISLSFVAHGQLVQEQKLEEYNEILPLEKTYVHTNKTIVKPGETIYFTVYNLSASLTDRGVSDIVHAKWISPTGEELSKLDLSCKNHIAKGSISTSTKQPGGIYRLEVYSRWQQNFNQPIYTKEITVLGTVTPRLLMKLDVEKEAYGPEETVLADLSIRNLNDAPIKNLEFEYTIRVNGEQVLKQTGTTDEEGEAQIVYQLPTELNGTDGTINVIFDYESNTESITRSIPIILNSIDLQFLPEGGGIILNQENIIAFKAIKNTGNPADVKGIIVDEQGNEITSFASFHQGMGKLSMNVNKGENYFAIIQEPYQSERIPLSFYTMNAKLELNRIDENRVSVNCLSANNKRYDLVVRSLDQIQYTESISGGQTTNINTASFPMGILQFMLFDEQKRPISQRLIFNHQDKGLQIQLSTNQDRYKTRDRVDVDVQTLDGAGKPIAATLSVSVVNDKLISYLDDKQHQIESWLLAGSELKGEIYEPKFYFDQEEENRHEALDLLLLTHGWSFYNWDSILSNQDLLVAIPPETYGCIAGHVFLKKKKQEIPFATSVFAEVNNRLYVTESDSTGFFQFNLIEPSRYSTSVYVLKKNRQEVNVEFWTEETRDSLVFKRKAIDELDLPAEEGEEESTSIERIQDNFEFDSDSVDEIAIAVYRSESTSVTGSIAIVSSEEIESVLQGKAAGVKVTNVTGSPGTSPTVRIRGAGGISGSNTPLYIVDGVAVESGEIPSLNNYTGVTVLKDAAATSIYGSRGANGVILLSTKHYHNFNNIVGKKTDLKPFYFYENKYYNHHNAKEFYIPKYETNKTQYRNDYRSCIYWNYNLVTNDEGKADFYFYNSDEATVFRIIAEGVSSGIVGRGEHTFSIYSDIDLEMKIPLYANEGDQIIFPVTIKNNTNEVLDANLVDQLPRNLRALDYKQDIVVNPDESHTEYIPVYARYSGEDEPLRFSVRTNDFYQANTKEIDVYERGFPMAVQLNTTTTLKEEFVVNDVVPSSRSAKIKIYLNPLEQIFNGIDKMIRRPHGCFEQVSSTTYPNIYVLELLQSDRLSNDYGNARKARVFLKDGYSKLAKYEVKGGGFDLWGRAPANDVLTAFGLVEFVEMSEHISVDEKMLQRTKEYLLSRKDGQGGYNLQEKGYYFKTNQAIANAYITYALSLSGEKNIGKEYKQALQEAQQSRDPYRMALMANTAFHLGQSNDYNDLLRILKISVVNYSINKIQAEGSITHSRGRSLENEILALTALAFMHQSNDTGSIHQLMRNLIQNANGGYFGSTQATGLSLKAVAQYYKNYMSNQSTDRDHLRITINNDVIFNGTMAKWREEEKSMEVFYVTKYLNNRENTIEIEIDSEQFTVAEFDFMYRSTLPPNSAEAQLKIAASLSETEVSVGDAPQLTVQVQNISPEAQPTAVAKIGIPGGLSPEPDQLKELIENEQVAYYEIMDNFLVLYWDKFAPNENKTIRLDLKAQVPGNYTGSSSSVYLYYTEEYKHWQEGIQVTIEP